MDTKPIIDKIFGLAKHCYLPATKRNKEIQYLAYNSNTPLTKNDYGLFEPDIDTANPCAITQLDLVITPLVLFDKHCHRVGWGYGYYDRTFSFLKNRDKPKKPFLLGIAYELQKQEYLQPAPWDVSLDAVLTETAIYTA